MKMMMTRGEGSGIGDGRCTSCCVGIYTPYGLSYFAVAVSPISLFRVFILFVILAILSTSA